MSYKIHVFLFILGLNIAHSQNNPCTTGICTNLENCPYLKILQKSSTQQYLATLEQRKCGTSGPYSLFCCPNEETRTHQPASKRRLIDDDAIYFPKSDSLGKVINARPNIDPRQYLPTDCGPISLSSRITGGIEAALGEYPWMVGLQYRIPHGHKLGCGGSLINERYVLTAAHCVVKSPGLTLKSVRLGEHNTKTDPDCQGAYETSCADPVLVVRIVQAILHENYNPNSTDQHNDIALLRLAQPVAFTRYIQPICLPETEEIASTFVATGWGLTEATEAMSDILLSVGLRLFDHGDCRDLNLRDGNPTVIVDSQICAGGEVSEDTCRGDSGGPLMQVQKNSRGVARNVLFGITSYGYSECGLGKPTTYTKVYSFVPWILSKLRP